MTAWKEQVATEKQQATKWRDMFEATQNELEGLQREFDLAVAQHAGSLAQKDDELVKIQTLLQRFKDKVEFLISSETELKEQLALVTEENNALESSVPAKVEELASLSSSHGTLQK